MPGRNTGNVTQKKVRNGPAPTLIAARSRLRSNPLSAAESTRKATGTDSTVCAITMPTKVSVSPTRG